VSALAAAPAASVAPGPRIYVTNERSGDLSVIEPAARRVVATVIDTATDRPTASLEVGARPWGIATGR
jgi:YVTN family beta-propeller protein